MSDLNMQLTKNFNLREFCNSYYADRHGIENVPDAKVIDNLRALCGAILQPLRDVFGPIQVLSGYRCPMLNKAIGGAFNSQHMSGQAADIQPYSSTDTNLDLVNRIANSKWPFDQLILECYKKSNPHSGWVHVSYGPKMRKEVLTYTNKQYLKGIVI